MFPAGHEHHAAGGVVLPGTGVTTYRDLANDAAKEVAARLDGAAAGQLLL